MMESGGNITRAALLSLIAQHGGTMATPHDERSIPELMSDVANQTGDLVRTEVRLARAELSEKVAQIESGVILLAGGGLVAYSGFLILLLAAVFGLANWIDPWLSALIVGAVIVIVGVIMLMKGRNNMRGSNLTPDRTLSSAQKDAELAKSEVRR